MYQTETLLRRRLRVRYPPGQGKVVLRTELDWETDLEPVLVEGDGDTFQLALGKPGTAHRGRFV